MEHSISPEKIFLAVVPQQNWDGETVAYSIILANFSKATLQYEAEYFSHKRSKKLSNTIAAEKHVVLEGFKFSEFNDMPSLYITFEIKEESIEKEITFKAKSLIKKPAFMQLIQKNAFEYELWNALPKNKKTNPKIEKTGYEPLQIDTEQLRAQLLGGKKTISSNTHIRKGSHAIDLHIETLNPAMEGLPSAEILQYQMGEFIQFLDQAIISNHHSIVVIHGIGDGVLKKKIVAYCQGDARVKSCGTPHLNKYAGGATEIFF